MNTLIEELMTRVNELSSYHDLDPVKPLPVWSTVTSDMFTQIYGSGSVLGDGRLTLGQNQTVLLPSDATHIRATPGAQVGGYRLLGMVLGVKPEGEPSESGNMIAAFTYFNGNAVMRAHINNGTTIALAETSGSNQYQPSGWSNNVNPIVNLLGQNTSTDAFELEKIDTYKIKVTNTTSG